MDKKNQEETSNIDVSSWIAANAAPIGGQISVGAVFGYCSGYTLQKLGSVAAMLVGAGFTFVQGLAYYGYIDVNWNRVQSDLLKGFDFDGDGEITIQDAAAAFRHLEKVLLYNLPAGAGFTAGLMYGMGGHVRTAGKIGLMYGVGGQLLRGAAATTAPALASLPYEAIMNFRSAVTEKISSFQEEPIERQVEAFRAGLEGKSLKELREMEASTRSEAESAESEWRRSLAGAKLKEIEEMKARVKKSSWWPF